MADEWTAPLTVEQMIGARLGGLSQTFADAAALAGLDPGPAA